MQKDNKILKWTIKNVLKKWKKVTVTFIWGHEDIRILRCIKK